MHKAKLFTPSPEIQVQETTTKTESGNKARALGVTHATKCLRSV
jgi:hypothetical protein